MSILIKDMEMPKGRPVCIVIDAAGQARRYDLNNDRYADDELFEAVSVPPHGRLADMNELGKKYDEIVHNFCHGNFRSGWDFLCEVREILDNAPTIIEGRGESDVCN